MKKISLILTALMIAALMGCGGAKGKSNSMPVINSISVAPRLLPPNGTATAVVSAYDPDGNTLSYSWATSTGWSVTGYGTTATVTAPNTYSAIGYITVTVHDDFGDTVSGTVVLSTASVLPPANLTATAGNQRVGLAWSVSIGAASYSIYKSTTSGGPYTVIGITTTTGYTVTELTKSMSSF